MKISKRIERGSENNRGPSGEGPYGRFGAEERSILIRRRDRARQIPQGPTWGAQGPQEQAEESAYHDKGPNGCRGVQELEQLGATNKALGQHKWPNGCRGVHKVRGSVPLWDHTAGFRRREEYINKEKR